MNPSRITRWQQGIWTGAGLGLLLTIAALLTFTGSTVSRVVELIAARTDADLAFLFSSIGVVTMTLLRLLAVLIGAAIAFAGLAVSFFAHEQPASLAGEASGSVGSAKVALATYAPGIVGVLVGAIVIVCALLARSKHDYRGPETYSVVLPPQASASEPAGPTARTLRSPEELLKPAAPASASR